jgi:hypothetical protein
LNKKISLNKEENNPKEISEELIEINFIKKE